MNLIEAAVSMILEKRKNINSFQDPRKAAA